MHIDEYFLGLALSGSAWVLWLLVAMSVASVAVIVERAWLYRVLARREAALAQTSSSSLVSFSAQVDTPGARMLRRAVRETGDGCPEIGLALEATRAVEQVELERNLSILGTIAANAPFVGLLGTVLEILRVFAALGEQGVASSADASAIMTGLSEALVATGVGLLVAIPATAAYNAFIRRVTSLLSQAQETATRGITLASDGGR